MASNYSEKLKDPRWQKKRLEILQRDDFSCCFCSDETSTLNVHHLQYNGNPWDAENDNLITLCENCHEIESKERLAAEKNLLQALKICGYSTDCLNSLSTGLTAYSKNSPYTDEVTTKSMLIEACDALEWAFIGQSRIHAIIHEKDDFDFGPINPTQ